MKNQTLLRTVSLILSALTVVFCFAACSDSTSQNNEETTAAPGVSDTVETEPEVTMLTDGLPDTDFEEAEFRIISAIFYNKELANYLITEELTGDAVDDQLYNSKIYIEDRFNVKMSIIATGSDTAVVQTTVRNDVRSGDNAFEIQIGHDTQTATIAKEGCFFNLYDIPQFNFDMPWWPKMACDNLSVCGKLYFASNYMSYCGLHWTRALCVNKTMADEFNREIPYNTVREGKWTLDAMFTFIEDVYEDVDGNGKLNAKDRMGFATGSQTWYCMEESLACSPYIKDKTDYPILDINIDRLTKMVEKLDWLVDDSGIYVNEGDFAVISFSNNRALLAFTQIGDAYDTYRESDVVYGFLPSPKLDESQESYINCCTDVPWAIPITVGDNIEMVATICEALSCRNYNYVLPTYFDVAMKSRTADSVDDAEMLQLIADTRTIGFAYMYGLNFNNIIGDVVGSTKELSSYIATTEKAATKVLDKLIMTFEDLD